MSLLPACLLSFSTCADYSAKSTLPINGAIFSQSSQKTSKSQKKRVRFPSAVLMQQAITEGDADEIKQLISEHGDKVVEEREPSGLPPVMRAVFESQTECLKVLVEAGADLTARDEEHWTALHVAAAMDDMEAAEFIVSCSSNHDNVNLVTPSKASDRSICWRAPRCPTFSSAQTSKISESQKRNRKRAKDRRSTR